MKEKRCVIKFYMFAQYVHPEETFMAAMQFSIMQKLEVDADAHKSHRKKRVLNRPADG